jgi:hypothetical protein
VDRLCLVLESNVGLNVGVATHLLKAAGATTPHVLAVYGDRENDKQKTRDNYSANNTDHQQILTG